jgi:hypothetical protein
LHPMSIPNSPPYPTPDMSDGAMAEPFVSTSYRRPGAYHVLLLTTGSVASIKIPLIVQALLDDPDQRFEVQVAATNTSLTFFDSKLVEEVSKGKSRVWSDEQEWGVSRVVSGSAIVAQSISEILALEKQRRSNITYRSKPALPIRQFSASPPPSQLRRWADIVLVCPCSANTLAKIANGLCDNVVVRPPEPPLQLIGSPRCTDLRITRTGSRDAGLPISRHEYIHVYASAHCQTTQTRH